MDINVEAGPKEAYPEGLRVVRYNKFWAHASHQDGAIEEKGREAFAPTTTTRSMGPQLK